MSKETTGGLPQDPKKFELYLLVGQSNMAGRGELAEADRLPDSRIYSLDKNNKWICRGEPIHFDKPDIAGVGLAFTFAKLMADRKPGISMGLIPCAMGGTTIAQWKPGSVLFTQAVERAKIARQTGMLKGILWHQGEGESDSEERASAYGENLKEIVAAFRDVLNEPDISFIAGQIGEFLYNQSEPNETPFARIVNDQIEGLPGRISRVAVASATGLGHRGDELHFDATALKEFGKRYFEEFVALEEKP